MYCQINNDLEKHISLFQMFCANVTDTHSQNVIVCHCSNLKSTMGISMCVEMMPINVKVQFTAASVGYHAESAMDKQFDLCHNIKYIYYIHTECNY